MTTVVNNENKVDMINFVTIPIWEYRDLVTKGARYDLLQEQEAQQKASLEAFKKTLDEGIAALGNMEKPAPVTVRKYNTVDEVKAAAKSAIHTEVVEKDDNK